MSKRVLGVLVAAVVVASVGAVVLNAKRSADLDGPSQGTMAKQIGSDVMEHIYRGHVRGRSGEIYLVPRPHFYMVPGARADLRKLWTDEPVLISSHPNPWDYLTRVPIIMHGDRWAGSGETNYDVVDIADVPATYAELLDVETEEELDGEPLAGFDTGGPDPKVIFTVVIDGGGWNVLEQHAASHPFIDSLREEGTTYMNATIASAPSITGALHATFGTGVYPNRHGLPGNRMRGPDGEDTDTWREDADPRYLQAPTVPELWDEQRGNRPVVASVSYEGWHLGMIGHGAQRDGGDKDIAALWEQEPGEWWINEDYYRLPRAIEETDVARLESYEDQLDPRDGLPDGTWFGHELEYLREPTVRPGTPAFVRFTGDAVVDMLRDEGIGTDDVTDFVWIEMKMPDFAGHAWNMINPEQGDVLRETDRQLARFKQELDRIVGADEYVYAVSADHGQQPLPDLLEGWRINQSELETDITDAFGDVIQKVSPVDLYMDLDAIDEEGVNLDDVARFLGAYTIGDNIPDDAPGAERVPEEWLDDPIFAGAFSTDYLVDLRPDDIEAFGEGAYEEGRFTIDPGDGAG